jgi:putative transposase
LDEAKASAKKLKEKGKALTNESILQEFIEREATVKKKTRKQRQKEEQTYKPVPTLPKPEEEDLIETQEEETNLTSEIDDIEVWDLEEMKKDYEW